MRSLLVVALVAAACSNASPSGSHDAGDEADHDAGAASDSDAGTGVVTLPDDPTLAELAAYWDSIDCHIYACIHRLRETPEVCAKAGASTEYPFALFRDDLASVAEGRATYRASAGSSCGFFLSHVDTSADCFGPNAQTYREQYGAQFVQVCGDLLDGKVDDGGACDTTDECVPGGGCEFDRTPDCKGQCVVYLHDGDGCAGTTRECEPTSYCDGTKCVSRDLAPDGAACYDDGESCESGKCFDYQCKEVSASGGECVTDDDCSAGLFCQLLPPSTGRLGWCQAPALEGAQCGYTVECRGNQACAGYFWQYGGTWSKGTCSGRPANVGESCVPVADGYDYGDTGCFGDLTCDPTTSKCAEAPALGEACAMPGNRCGLDAWCDATGVCRAKKAAGESADGPAECEGSYDGYQHQCYDPAAESDCAY